MASDIEDLPGGERLQKVLAHAGIGSRRVCEEFIAEGRVRINGRVAELGNRVDPDADEICFDGAVIPTKAGLVHYLLNKPAGVISTAEDTHGRKTVVSLFPPEPRIYPVGRLDADSEGLLIVTNNGELTHRLTHPSFGVEKEYLVSVEGEPSRHSLRRLREGVELDDGVTAPAQVASVDSSLLRIVIHEGRNRQIRRMCETVGHPVTRLVRTRIGPIRDQKLAVGSWRELSTDEVQSIERAVAASTESGKG